MESEKGELMFDLLGIASLSFLAALSGAVVPGPVFALVVSESLRSGKIAGPLIALGHFLIEWFIILMVFLGLGPLLETEYAKIGVSCVGGALLMFMGIRLAKIALHLKIDENSFSKPNESKRISQNLVASGFLSSCSNPHIFLWWLTMGIPMIMSSISIAGAMGFASFLIGHVAADLSWFSFVSYSIHKGRRVLKRKAVQAILFISSAFLVAFSIYLIIFAINLIYSLICS